jgi:cytochrome c oxidase subunit III
MEQENVLTAEGLTLGQQQWSIPDRGTVGIMMLIMTESVLFLMFAAAYLIYIGKSVTGPYPQDVLRVPITSTVCLLSSSITMMLAERALERNELRGFKLWWMVTFALGADFLTATGLEWHRLIFDEHLTVSTNLFGTTFYSLVGLHASHVFVGLVFILVAMIATLLGFPIHRQLRRVKFLSWYWHFVDAVWVIVFTVVYVIGR